MTHASRLPLWCTSIACTLLLAAPHTTHAAPPSYTVIDLGHGDASEIRDFSGSTYIGNVGVGMFFSHAALLFPGPSPTRLPTGPNDNSGAFAVNTAGAIVGWSEIDAPDIFFNLNHAVLWSGGARLRYDEPLTTTNSYANDINDAGIAVGTWDTLAPGVSSNANVHAAKWNANRTVIDLSTPGESESVATAINNSGVTVGYRRISGKTSPVTWSANNTLTVLPDLTGNGGQAYAINDAGVIAGVSSGATPGSDTPFYYDGTIHPLPTLNTPAVYFIHDINANGSIVGSALVNSVQIPLLWDNGKLYDLRTLAPSYTSPIYGPLTLAEPYAIDDLGNIGIVGASPAPFAGASAVLLAVPEPASALFLLTATAHFLRRRPRWH